MKVTVNNVLKQFGSTTAVNNVSLEVMDKEFLVLLGPSGCGKTTLLRCIAGLEDPDEGEIFIGDKLVNDVPPKDRDIAMVFQTYALYPHMKAYDNLAYPLKMRKYPKNEIKTKVERVAELLHISRLLERKPRQLSGGEAQRVALGRAIIRDPVVYLMDEPLSNLDAKLRVFMRAELKKLQQELGVTTIYVTHDQVEAMTMSDRIAILLDGSLQQLGTAKEIYNNPTNTFVAEFIGSPPMNLIDCRLKQKDGKEDFLDISGLLVPISKEKGDLARQTVKTDELILGIRPEHIIVSGGESPTTPIEANVELIEPLGGEVVINIILQGTLVKARVHADLTIDPKNLWIGFPDEKIYLFDKTTKKTLI